MIALTFLRLLQQPSPERLFQKDCGSCHGMDARGDAHGPGLANNRRVVSETVDLLKAFLERGSTGNGMPAFTDLPGAELTDARQLCPQAQRRHNPG